MGIRPFTVDAVLDRLTALDAPHGDAEHEQVVRFLWELLTRERRSDFSTTANSERALLYAGHRWFWLVPGRADADESQQQRQRRERSLAQVRLPAADGTWQPASTLAFGADWADWIEAHLPYADAARRSVGMRQLERLAPSPRRLLAAPDVLLGYLPAASLRVEYDAAAGGNPDSFGSDEHLPEDQPAGRSEHSEVDPEPATRRAELQQFAFLLRLGCWEILPIEGHQTGRPVAGRSWPWPELRDELTSPGDAREWNFDAWQWSGTGHMNITVSEDARFQWPLKRSDHESRERVLTAMAAGADLYASLLHASALCPSCTTPTGNRHKQPYRTRVGEARASTLALQLKRVPWLPTAVAGVPADGHDSSAAWADLRGLDSAALRTSPLQHLPLVNVSGQPAALRKLCHLQALEEADTERLLDLHKYLRAAFTGSADRFLGNGRQSFVGLHRLIYEALSVRISGNQLPEDFEVLCELGSGLVYRRLTDCRHDDGRHAAHRPRFASRLPFVVLARDKTAVARGLGIAPFEVVVERRGTDEGHDVTGELQNEFTDRIPELLAVMVHQAGTNPLDPNGDAFRERSNRLRNLRVRRLDNLVLEVSVADMPALREVVGDSTRDESYLDTTQPGWPVIFHDMGGEGWRRRLSRRLASHLASACDVAGSHSDTFLLLLTTDDADREDLLRSWGVLPEHIHQIRVQIGMYTTFDRSRTTNWLSAICAVLGHSPEDSSTTQVDHDGIRSLLVRAGLTAGEAETASFAVTSDRPGDRSGPLLHTLSRRGVNLETLDAALKERHEPGLTIGVAGDRLSDWCDRHGERVVAALTKAGVREQTAKGEVAALSAAANLYFVLEPTPDQYLSCAVQLLGKYGLVATGEGLQLDPLRTLSDLIGCDVAELDLLVRELYDDEARVARLSYLAAGWAGELRLMALVCRASGAAVAVVRDEARQIDGLLGRPASPRELRAVLPDLFAGEEFRRLREALEVELVDDLPGEFPDRTATIELLERGGVAAAAVDAVLGALRRDQSKRVAVYTHQLRLLIETRVAISIPAGFEPPPVPRRPAVTSEQRSVAVGTVSVDIERRKKKIGDEAESWAVTSATRVLVDLDDGARRNAIEAILRMLASFGFTSGLGMDRLRGHAAAASAPHLDQEDLIERIAAFLHVAAYSDSFGFDLIAWVPDHSEEAGGYPMALEVKSSTGSFYFSIGEWDCATRMRGTDEVRAGYAILAVRRDGSSETPTAMDMLVDPVKLVEQGKLGREVDTYQMRYIASPIRQGGSAHSTRSSDRSAVDG